jgi:hypothetical protein
VELISPKAKPFPFKSLRLCIEEPACVMKRGVELEICIPLDKGRHAVLLVGLEVGQPTEIGKIQESLPSASTVAL